MSIPSTLILEAKIIVLIIFVRYVVIGMNYNGRYVMTCTFGLLLRKRGDAFQSYV